MTFKPSQSKKALLETQERIVEADGFQGCPYWLIRKSGSAAPPIPTRWRMEPKASAKAVSLVRRSKREKGSLGYVTALGPFNYEGTPARQLYDSLGHQWPFLVNAHFIAHVESCHPDGTWKIAADGRLVYWSHGRTPRLLGMVALIRPHGTSWRRGAE